MNSLPNPKVTYGIAFVIGAIIALLVAAPARSAEPFRLDRIAIVRFAAQEDGTLRQQNAVLHADGRVHLRATFTVPRPDNTPGWALGRNLIPVTSWSAYHALGAGALQQFELQDGGVRVYLGAEPFLLVAPSVEGPLATGLVVNLSAQVPISAGKRGV